MNGPRSVWLDVLDWLEAIDSLLPAIFPSELPPEGSVDFWFCAAQLEMSTRDELSRKIRSLIVGGLPSLTPLEAWLYRRRVEWAMQVALAKVKQGIEPDAPLSEVLTWILVSSWETEGCIGFWNHAERGGMPHPENPDGMSPI